LKGTPYLEQWDHTSFPLTSPPKRFIGSNEIREVSAEHVEHFKVQTGQLKKEVAELQSFLDLELVFKGQLEDALKNKLVIQLQELEADLVGKCNPSRATKATVFDEKAASTKVGSIEQRQQELSARAIHLHHTVFETSNDQGVLADLQKTKDMLLRAKELESIIADTENEIQGIVKARGGGAGQPVLKQCHTVLTKDVRTLAESTRLLTEEIPQLKLSIKALLESGLLPM
jgi:hypothetical protein